MQYYCRYAVRPSQEDMANTYPELRWPLMQRYVPSARHRVYSVSGIKDAVGGVLAASVSYKREQWPPDVGVSTVQIGCEDEKILRAGLQVVDRILSRGIFEIELLVDGDHLYAIDLNPRAFGFVALDIARGVDLPWLWFRSTFEPQSALPRPVSGIEFEARHKVLHFLRRIVNRRPANDTLAPAECRDINSRVSVPMLGDWTDPLPMLICHLYLLRHPCSLVRSARR